MVKGRWEYLVCKEMTESPTVQRSDWEIAPKSGMASGSKMERLATRQYSTFSQL